MGNDDEFFGLYPLGNGSKKGIVKAPAVFVKELPVFLSGALP